MNRIKTPLHILAILFVIFTAWTLRFRAVNTLPIDYDEDDYLRAGQEYAHLIRTSNWSGFLETNYRPEHPPLAKIAYGIVFSFLPEQPLVADVSITSQPAASLPEDLLKAGRMEAAIFGTLTAVLLAIVNPLGGLMLAIHTFTIKYTSEIMLDGLSALLSLSTVLAYIQYKQKKQTGWLIASAVFLGLAADSKFLHGTVGFAILIDWALTNWSFIIDRSQRTKTIRTIFLWGVLALAVFFVMNPYLWTDPIERIKETLAAIHSTTTNPNVKSAGFPVWQQLTWLSMSVSGGNTESAFVFLGDTIIAFLAVIGFQQMRKKESVFGVWLLFELVVLLLWRTKWPQYILIVTVPLSLSAAEGVRVLWDHLLEWWKTRKTKGTPVYNKTETRRALPWLIPGLVAFAVLTLIPLVFQFMVSLTALNGNALRDGFQGGIWRELWGGILGQISPDNFADDGKVHYIGLLWYSDIFNWIGSMGLPFFNTLWTILSVALQTVLGVGAALLLWQRGIKFRRGWQALFILPWAIPEAIGTMLWLNIFAPVSGWLNLATQKFGSNIFFDMFKDWERSQNMTLVVLLISALWYGFPFMMLAASAGLKLLPHEVYDAASIDGANAWQTFHYVTWPLLMPLVVPAVIIRSIFAFNQFYLFQMFYFVDSNFRMFTLARLSYFLVYDRRDFTGSAIVNIITILFLTVFIILFNRWSKAGEGVTYA